MLLFTRAGRKQQMVTCVNSVLVKLPGGKKRFVVEGATFNKQESRFGKVVKGEPGGMGAKDRQRLRQDSDGRRRYWSPVACRCGA